MPLTREHASRAAKARGTRIALTCALICLAVLGLAAPAMAAHLNTSPPETARNGRTLSTTNGTWLGTDGTYSYAWQRCDSEELCAPPVPGRTAPTYLLTTADLGKRIRSVVTTDSLLGPDSAASELTDEPIVADPPRNSVPPAVTGSTQLGSALNSTLGTWTDPSPANVTYRRQWQRCTAPDGSGCQSIPGATGASYTTGSSDLGQFARVLVTAEGLGTRVVASPPVGPIANPPGSSAGSPGAGTGTGPGTNPPTGGPRKLRPFPRVIVAGRLARGLTFISGLEIRRGPRGAAVSVRCRGRGCPRGSFRGRLGRRGSLRLKRFQRIYGPGTVIEIRITRRGAIGKFTRLATRSRSVPARRDACLMPGSGKPRRCPRR